jgi:sulfopyruvate decarboxylase subunit beta
MMKRDECFEILKRHITDEVVVASYSSAVEWEDLNPRALNYYSVGAMGLGPSHALGLALGRPDKRIVVLDGDGSLLMNLGSLVTIAAAAPKNLVHFVCQNENYEANGGHPLPNPTVDFAGLARSAGYAHVHDFSELTSVAPRGAEGGAAGLVQPQSDGESRALSRGVPGAVQRGAQRNVAPQNRDRPSGGLE